jgi:hypothetical protein
VTKDHLSHDRRWSTPSLAALAAVLGATAFVLLRVGARQFPNYDGVWHVFVARQETWATFWSEVKANAHPPLFYLLLGASIKAFGKAFLAYRVVSIVATLGSTLLVARIVATLTSSRWLGVVAAASFGLSFSAVEIGTEVRAYSLGGCLVLAAFSAYVDWLGTSPARLPARKRAAFAGATSLALLTSYSTFFFLAAALAVPCLLFLADGRWRARLWREATQHRLAAGMMFLVPIVVAMTIYRVHARMWKAAAMLGHVGSFMYDAGHEGLWRFISRNTRSLVLLALPLWEPSGRAAVVAGAALLIGAALLLARRGFRRRLAVVPVLFLGVMLLLNLVAGIKARYPYGGQMRQEFFLFPFAIVALFTGIDAARRLLPRRWSARGPWVGATALGVAASCGLWMSTSQVDPNPPLKPQMDRFHAAFRQPAAVLVDQFNFIVLFAHYLDWDWHLEWQDPHRSLWQVWSLSRNGQQLRVCRSRDWLLDFSTLGAYSDVADCLSQAGPVTVFRPQQPEFHAAWDTRNTAALASELGPKAGALPTGLVVNDDDVYMTFLPSSSTGGGSISVAEATYGTNCGAPRGNATERVKGDCEGRSFCVYRVRADVLGDPAPGRPKDFTVAWTCSHDGSRRQATIEAEAGFGGAAFLTCAR